MLSSSVAWTINTIRTVLPTAMYWLDLSNLESSQTALNLLTDFILASFDWTRHSDTNAYISNSNVLVTLLGHPNVKYLLDGMEISASAEKHGWHKDAQNKWFTCEGPELVEFYLFINIRRAMLASREGIPDIIKMLQLLNGHLREDIGIPLSNVNEFYERALSELVYSMGRFFIHNKLHGPNNGDLLDHLMAVHTEQKLVRAEFSVRSRDGKCRPCKRDASWPVNCASTFRPAKQGRGR